VTFSEKRVRIGEGGGNDAIRSFYRVVVTDDFVSDTGDTTMIPYNVVFHSAYAQTVPHERITHAYANGIAVFAFTIASFRTHAHLF
jgi:hypothetical protein